MIKTKRGELEVIRERFCSTAHTQRMHSVANVMSGCLSVCLSVRPSVTRQYTVSITCHVSETTQVGLCPLCTTGDVVCDLGLSDGDIANDLDHNHPKPALFL